MKNIYFFATPQDISEVLVRFENKAPLKYIDTGTRHTSERHTFLSSEDIPNLGKSSHETGSLSSGYLVSLRDTPNASRISVTASGDRRWNLYNGDNPGTVALTPAGLWREMLLAGNMGTVHDDSDAQNLMRWFQSALKAERFSKTGRFWVGKEAFSMLQSGCRLSTTAEQSPPDFDLKLEQVAQPPN